MPFMENSSLLFSSCHLDLDILENSEFFACYFEIQQAKKNQLFSEITNSRCLERFCPLFSK